MEADKTEIEIAIEYVVRRLMLAKAHSLIDELTDALGSLIKARNDERGGLE
jgi:hypothetical protein